MQNQETQTYQQKDQMGKNKDKEGNTQKSGEKNQSSKTQKKDDDMGGGCSC